MQVKTITVNAADLAAAGRGIPTVGLPGVNGEQAGRKNVFGPECEVTISREGRNLSRHTETSTETNPRSTQKAAAKGSQSYLPQKQFNNLRDALTEMYRGNGFTGEELLERVEATYQEIQKRAQGGIQFSLKKPTDEETAAMNELARKSIRVEDVTVDSCGARDLRQAAQAYQEIRV